MAIDTAKFLGRSSDTATLSNTSVENISTIASTLIDVNTIMKGSLLLDKLRDKKKKKKDQEKKRNLKEAAIEKIKGAGKGIKDQAMKSTEGMRDWLNRLVMGVALIGLVKLLPLIEPWLPTIGEWVDGMIRVAGWVFNFTVTLIEWAYKLYDGLRGFVGNIFGEKGLEVFDSLMGHLNNLFNAAIMAVMALMKFKWLRGFAKNMLRRGSVAFRRFIGRGGRKLLKAPGKLLGKVVGAGKGVLTKGASKVGGFASKIFGKAAKFIAPAFKSAKPFVSKFFGRVPIVGPLVVGIVSIVSGDPIGQALFKTIGAALGGFLGTFIPIPVLGTLLGETIGVFVGDMLYTLMFGGGLSAVGAKLKKQLLGIFNAGKKVFEWVTGGFGRFWNEIPKIKIPDFPKDPPDWIPKFVPRKKFLWNLIRTAMKVMIGPLSLLMGKEIPNLLWLYNPFKTLPALVKSFFPPSGEGSSASLPSAPSGTTDADSGGSTPPPEGDVIDKESGAKVIKPPADPPKAKKKASPIASTPSTNPSQGIKQYPSYDTMSTPKTKMLPLPPQVIPVGQGGSIPEFSASFPSGDDAFEAFYAHSGGLV